MEIIPETEDSWPLAKVAHKRKVNDKITGTKKRVINERLKFECQKYKLRVI
jgi:hypothetical protein